MNEMVFQIRTLGIVCKVLSISKVISGSTEKLADNIKQRTDYVAFD